MQDIQRYPKDHVLERIRKSKYNYHDPSHNLTGTMFAKVGEERLSQAERVIAKFGGARKVADALAAIGKPRDPASIYRWTYPIERRGTGGLIPMRAWANLLEAARFCGVLITAEDMDPRVSFREIIKRVPIPKKSEEVG